MSMKRIVGITVFGLFIIAAAVALLLFSPYLVRDVDPVQLPSETTVTDAPSATAPDTLDRVEVTRENVRAVVASLVRPEIYSRTVTVETYWEGGQALYTIRSSVCGGMTALRISASADSEKRVVITPDALYIWYRGDRTYFTGKPDPAGGGTAAPDEWQMLVSVEDVLGLDLRDIEDAGYAEYGGVNCIYIAHRTALLGYSVMCFISVESGLVTGAEEFDENGALVYKMFSGECRVGEFDEYDFMLPDMSNPLRDAGIVR